MAGIEDIKTLFLDSIATYFAINYHRNIRSITYIFEVENTNMRSWTFQNPFWIVIHKNPTYNLTYMFHFTYVFLVKYLFIFWAICN